MKYAYLAIILTFISCSSNPHSERIREVEVLRTELEEAGELLEEFNKDTLEVLENAAIQQLSFIQRKYTDTIQHKDARFLGDYKTNYRNMSKLVKRYEAASSQVALRTQQLENLQADLENNFLTEVEADSFLAMEREIAQELYNASGSYEEKSTVLIRRHHSYYPKADSFILVMKQNGMR